MIYTIREQSLLLLSVLILDGATAYLSARRGIWIPIALLVALWVFRTTVFHLPFVFFLASPLLLIRAFTYPETTEREFLEELQHTGLTTEQAYAATETVLIKIRFQVIGSAFAVGVAIALGYV